MSLSPNNANRSLWVTAFTALMTAVASSLCCIGPLIYLLFGISVPWLVGLEQLEYLRIPMLLLSLSAFSYGFWLLVFSKRVICNKYLSAKQLLILYWLMFIIILFFLFYPIALPWILS